MSLVAETTSGACPLRFPEAVPIDQFGVGLKPQPHTTARMHIGGTARGYQARSAWSAARKSGSLSRMFQPVAQSPFGRQIWGSGMQMRVVSLRYERSLDLAV